MFVQYCFMPAEALGTIKDGEPQDGHLDFHTVCVSCFWFGFVFGLFFPRFVFVFADVFVAVLFCLVYCVFFSPVSSESK